MSTVPGNRDDLASSAPGVGLIGARSVVGRSQISCRRPFGRVTAVRGCHEDERGCWVKGSHRALTALTACRPSIGREMSATAGALGFATDGNVQ